jgi:hypothetical protein
MGRTRLATIEMAAGAEEGLANTITPISDDINDGMSECQYQRAGMSSSELWADIY